MVFLLELPPRARRILLFDEVKIDGEGTTSACAENTLHRRTRAVGFWNYLRVRGEYGVKPSAQKLLAELPPRARRIRCVVGGVCAAQGTTSACAENTGCGRRTCTSQRNYLRVRGEYTLPEASHSAMVELPPRARRIHHQRAGEADIIGTTSACAENTGFTGVRCG